MRICNGLAACFRQLAIAWLEMWAALYVLLVLYLTLAIQGLVGLTSFLGERRVGARSLSVQLQEGSSGTLFIQSSIAREVCATPLRFNSAISGKHSFLSCLNLKMFSIAMFCALFRICLIYLRPLVSIIKQKSFCTLFTL
ncbi:hypothetical protein MNBD_PLANCTO02-1435 [hydrothermal vent metagenome]|uniref:Uncharacterized protein n=1 Tax=hydrothermal vent metagenome TaxID=652676 RepID=A0A3B1DEL0_9ZZZZ